MQQASKYSDTQSVERNIQNLKTCGSEVCRWRAWAWGTPCHIARRAQIPTGLVSVYFGLFSRSLMKGGSWSPSYWGPRQGSVAVAQDSPIEQLGDGRFIFSLCYPEGMWVGGTGEEGADRTLEHWWSPGSHTKATPWARAGRMWDDIPVQTHSVFWVSLSLPLRPHHLPLAFSGGAVRST